MFNNLRPGVYTRHDLSGAGYPGGDRAAALILRRGEGIPQTVSKPPAPESSGEQKTQ